MAISNTVTVRPYGGSLLATNLLSGSATNLVLNSMGASSRTTLVENSNQLVVGETVSLGGRQVSVLGAGTMQPGVNVLGATVALGTAVPVVFVRDLETGGISLVFPAGEPNFAGAVAMVVTARPVSYTFPGGVLCFARGTRIATPRGPVPVEALRPQQRVLTLDRGPRPVLRLVTRDLTPDDLDARPNLLPVRIPAGALGAGRPARDLVVSPQHRILIDSPHALALHGHRQVLVAARHLVGFAGIAVQHPPAGIGYVHVILARHALLLAEDCVSESFFAGPEALRALDPAARADVMRRGLVPMAPVRPFLTKTPAQALVTAILQEGAALQQADYAFALPDHVSGRGGMVL